MLTSALWLGAWLRGQVAPDEVLVALGRATPDAPAVIAVDGRPDAPLADLLAHARRRRADGCWVLLPRPGRTVGWPAALVATPAPAVLLTSRGSPVALLTHDPAGWSVASLDAGPDHALLAGALTAREAARGLAGVLAEATDRLEALGLERSPSANRPPRWAPALARGPRALDPATAALLDRLAGPLDALGLALADDGAAVTAAEAAARRASLVALAGALSDLLVGVVGGLNPPAVLAPADAPPHSTAQHGPR